MAVKDPEKRREYQKRYRLENKDKIKAALMARQDRVRNNARSWRLANPDRVRAGKRRYYLKNRGKALAASEAWRVANRPRVWLSRHNVDDTWLQETIEMQSNACAVCRVEFTDTPHVDHDHKCCPGSRSCGECVRGLLCTRCNPGIGYFRDDPALLRAAADYLEAYA